MKELFKELFNLVLLECWRRGGALGIVVAGALSAFPVSLVFSWLSDPAPPEREIVAAASVSWTGSIAGFRYDPTRGLIAVVHGPAGEVEVMFSGIDMPLGDRRTPIEALKWLKREVRTGTFVMVYTLEPENPLYPMRGHLVIGNRWLNGSLVEQGLALLSTSSPVKKYNAGRDALRPLQVEARAHGRGLWRKSR